MDLSDNSYPLGAIVSLKVYIPKSKPLTLAKPFSSVTIGSPTTSFLLSLNSKVAPLNVARVSSSTLTISKLPFGVLGSNSIRIFYYFHSDWLFGYVISFWGFCFR